MGVSSTALDRIEYGIFPVEMANIHGLISGPLASAFSSLDSVHNPFGFLCHTPLGGGAGNSWETRNRCGRLGHYRRHCRKLPLICPRHERAAYSDSSHSEPVYRGGIDGRFRGPMGDAWRRCDVCGSCVHVRLPRPLLPGISTIVELSISADSVGSAVNKNIPCLVIAVARVSAGAEGSKSGSNFDRLLAGDSMNVRQRLAFQF